MRKKWEKSPCDIPHHHASPDTRRQTRGSGPRPHGPATTLGIYDDQLYLVTGALALIDNGDGTSTYSVTDNGDGTTTLAIDSAATAALPGWEDPASWADKTGRGVSGRGLILVHGRDQAYNTYQVLAADSASITIRGPFEPVTTAAGPDPAFGLIYGQLIRSRIEAGTVTDPGQRLPKDVTFFDPNTTYGAGGLTDQDAPRRGICQICHTQTAYWTEDGAGDSHHSATRCTGCHLAADGFKPATAHLPGDGTFTWETSCAACHDPGGNTKIIADLHGNQCTTCHTDTSGGALAPGTSAANATPGVLPHLCTECHVDSYGQHHATAKAQAGDCTWCHADPRPQWQSAYGLTGTQPRQLACRECHVEAGGTGLVVYKLDFPVTPADTITFAGNDLSQPPENAKTVVKTVMDGTNGTTNHLITGAAKIDIYNYGACLSCHDGTTATRVNVWHARPKYSEIPPDSSTDAYRMHFDTLRYAPGRSVFNLWRGDGLQGEPYFSHRNDFYDNGDPDAATRGADFFDPQGGRNVITWNWGATASPYTMTTIPCFRETAVGNDIEGLCGENTAAASEQVPVFDNGPTRDTITVTKAAYDGTTLTVRAANTNGILALRAADGRDLGPMTGTSGGAWSADLPVADLPGDTIDIMTSNPLGINAAGIAVCRDPVTIGRAEWDPVHNNTLTVEASNLSGPTAPLTVTGYLGADYPMTDLGGGNWRLVLTNVAFQGDVTVAGACDTTTAPVADLTDTITVIRAVWDPAAAGAELQVEAVNTSPYAVLLADFGSSVDIPMHLNTATGHWELSRPAPAYAPTVRVHSDYFGDTTALVTSYGEQLTNVQANYDTSTATLSLLAMNEMGAAASLYADYNGQTYPLLHVDGRRWQLLDQLVTGQSPDVRVWSTGGGNVLAAVTACASDNWPPPTTGTLLDAGSYWHTTAYDPDRLRISVNIGQEQGTPRLRLDGSGTPRDFLCSEIDIKGVYRCQIESNELAGAGYDGWAVIYTGSNPGAAAVLDYPIDWSTEQTLQPVTVPDNGLPYCQPLQWDAITSAAAFWDGADLHAEAANTWGAAAPVSVDYGQSTLAMTQDAAGTWRIDATVPYAPDALFLSDAGGYQQVHVADMTSEPDTITITDSGWNDDGAGTLTVAAANTYGGQVQLSVVYGATTTPMTWTGSGWRLDNVTGIANPGTVSVVSSAPAGGSATATVEDRTPVPYPPACDAGNGMDQIVLPLDKAHFDPDKGDELHVKINNVINQSYGAQYYMMYSENAAQQTVYHLPWASDYTFEYIGTGFTWSPGATVTVWSENDQGKIMDVACDQPVFHKNLTDTITVTKAQWDPATSTLVVEAQNTAANGAQLYVDYDTLFAVPMTWDQAAGRWTLSVSNVNLALTVRVYSDTNGDTTADVLDLTPDTITITDAYWTTDGSTGDLSIRAVNSQGSTNQLYIDYGTTTGQPMTWDPNTGAWTLLLFQTTNPGQVRIWSQRPGEAAATVEDLSTTHDLVTATPSCLACHPTTDIVFTIHQADCASCHNSDWPQVQDAITSGQGGSCTTCHETVSTRIRATEISFNYPGSNAIALKDHNRPNSDILVPVPEFVLDTRNEPAAYPQGATVTIQAVFAAESDVTSAWIGSSLFPPQEVIFTNGVSAPVSFTLPASVTATAGIDRIRLDWNYCDENNSGTPDCAAPQALHDSHHTIYVTHAAPTAAAPFFTKLVEYSIKWSADAVDEQGIVDSIYDGIWILGTEGYSYQYPFLARTGTRVGDVLRYRAGACGEWAAFMQRAIEVQGVDVYVVDIVPDQRDNLVAITSAIGKDQETYLFGDHAFVVYGVPYIQSVVPTLGTAYDPSFHHTGPGWGGYEDVLFPYLEESDDWYPNPGYGNGPDDDVVDTKIREVTDDFIVDESRL